MGASRSDSGLIVALGDSVSYGYGLDGNKNDKGLYVNKLAEKLESDIQNYSIVGADSNVLRSFTERAVAGKDMSNLKLNRVISDASLITVSIGGNDVLGVLYSYAAQNDLGLVEAMAIMITSDEARDGLAALLEQSVTEFKENFTEIIKNIRKINPECVVVVQTVYNPFSMINELKNFSAFAEKYILQINECISGMDGITVADVHSSFESDFDGYDFTNMRYADIHPNEAGHNAMFMTVYKALYGELPYEIEDRTDGGGLIFEECGVNLKVFSLRRADGMETERLTAEIDGNVLELEFKSHPDGYYARIPSSRIDGDIMCYDGAETAMVGRAAGGKGTGSAYVAVLSLLSVLVLFVGLRAKFRGKKHGGEKPVF